MTIKEIEKILFYAKENKVNKFWSYQKTSFSQHVNVVALLNQLLDLMKLKEKSVTKKLRRDKRSEK